MRDYIFIDQDLDQLRKDIYGSKRRFFRRLDDQCRSYMSRQLPEEHPSESTTYFGLAIANLSLCYILTKQKHYFDEAMRWIRSVTGFEHWGNAHLVDVDLSAAWILFGLGIGFDWLKDEMNADDRQTVEDKILLQARRMYQYKIGTEGNGWSTSYWQNHNWINLTGLAAAGYALRHLGQEPEIWIKCAKDNFEIVFDSLSDDGSDYEGVVYWRYGAMWLFVYAHLLKEREGIDYFKQSAFLKNTFFYRLYQAVPNLEEQVNFGDCHDRRSGHSTAIYYKTASEYNNGYAQYLGDLVVDRFLYREALESQVKPGILPECFFELLFYNPQVESRSFEDLPLIKYFEDLGLIVVRSSWRNDAIHFSFKCGAPGGKKQWEKLWELKRNKGYDCFSLSHQHPDNNSFILHANSVYMAVDDGYNRTVKASDHNMILVDGEGFQDENRNNVYRNYLPHMTGKIEAFKVADNYVYFAGETADTYKHDLKMKHIRRQILYDPDGCFIIRDEIESENEHCYTWVMHADTWPAEISGNDPELSQLIYENGPGSMKVYHWANLPVELNYLENNVRCVMTTQEPDKFRETKMKTVHFTSKEKAKSIEYIHILIPYPSDKVPKTTASITSSLHGYLIRVQYDGTEKGYSFSRDGRISVEIKDTPSKVVILS